VSPSSSFFVVGLSHHTAPVSVREKVAVSEGTLAAALEGLRKLDPVEGALVVSTCNRVEVYATTVGDAPGAARAVRNFLAVQDPGVDGHLYERHGPEAVRHLFRVASSLDSMVIGEPQILGQVKDAYAAAEAAGAVNPFLARAFKKAFGVAKRVRTETAIGKSAVSMSFAAVELGKKILGSLDGATVALVGAGKMSALAARHMQNAGCQKILVTNRSQPRGEALAAECGGEMWPWGDLGAVVAAADVVICSTAAPHAVITVDLVAAARKARRHRPLFFVDLAVPRDVDPRVNDLDDVYVYDVDDLDKVIDENRKARAEEALKAEALVAAEAQSFSVAAKEGIGPVLRDLRLHGEEVARAEVERTLAKIGATLTPAQRQSIEAMARAVVNKLLHGPTTRLRRAAEEEDGRLIDAALELFAAEEGGRGKHEPREAPVVRLVAGGETEAVRPSGTDDAAPAAAAPGTERIER
jgi:glutamyl-tRNA reductase